MVDGAAVLDGADVGLRADRPLAARSRGTNLLDTGAPFYDTYETADGKWISLGSIEPQFYARAARARSGLRPRRLPAQMDRARLARAARAVHRASATKTRDEWSELLEGTDVVLRAGADDERGEQPSAHRGARDDRRATTACAQPAPAPRFSRTAAEIQGPAAVARCSTPTRRSRDWGFTDDEIAKLRDVGRGRSSGRAEPGRVDERDERAARELSSSGRRAVDGDVAELAPGPRRLAVVVQVRARDREHRVAVGHRRRCN